MKYQLVYHESNRINDNMSNYLAQPISKRINQPLGKAQISLFKAVEPE